MFLSGSEALIDNRTRLSKNIDKANKICKLRQMISIYSLYILTNRWTDGQESIKTSRAVYTRILNNIIIKHSSHRNNNYYSILQKIGRPKSELEFILMNIYQLKTLNRWWWIQKKFHKWLWPRWRRWCLRWFWRLV